MKTDFSESDDHESEFEVDSEKTRTKIPCIAVSSESESDGVEVLTVCTANSLSQILAYISNRISSLLHNCTIHLYR